MPRLANRDDLLRMGAEGRRRLSLRESMIHILSCTGTGCTASDSSLVISELRQQIARRKLESTVRLVQAGCRGFCAMGPVMMVFPEGIFYCQVQPSDAAEIVDETIVAGRPVERLLYRDPTTGNRLLRYADIPFYRKQQRIALRNCGFIDPEDVSDYLGVDGYQSLARALFDMAPGEIIETVKASGLRGRGGAGFPTGLKWELCKRSPGDSKYIVCNADEGDPGAFMDRSILEGDPHTVLEGMMIAGRAIDAHEGYIYCRAEYPLAVKRLRIAIDQAREHGLVGRQILGSDFDFDFRIKEGAGAFVCGEETALIDSIEGRRGMPKPRPPFPTTSGLWGKPTSINNVETWANVPPIIREGHRWFAAIGTEKSKGTKVFALTGKVSNIGLVEVPMGISLGDIVFDVGGGIPDGKRFKAVQTGGPLGGCLPAEMLNTPVDYDSLTGAGATMGSGGMIVVDEDTCMVEFAKFFLTFAHAESCGQCTPCRIGGKRMLEVLTRITEGRGTMEDLGQIETLARGMSESSLCALGQLTPSPTISSIRHFRDEFVAHIVDKRCPAGTCKDLVYSRCSNACPAGQDVPKYMGLIAQGRFAEAYQVITATNPFPSICGRVCEHPCESKCRRGQLDDPLSIRALKRFVADQMRGERPARPELRYDRKVAVIGGGPAGLAAAQTLARQGYPVTVFEALPVLGGMLAVGIPEYRLPAEVLNDEIENVAALGVELRTGVAMGRDFDMEQLKHWGYDATFLAIGAHASISLGLPGEESEAVVPGVSFLRDANIGTVHDLAGRRVAVVGGGNVAMDAARVAVRMGASQVHVVYRRGRDEMPAQREEIDGALQEGVLFHFLAAPKALLNGTGGVTGIRCSRMALDSFDRSGRRRPVEVEGSEFVVDADLVIAAIGQTVDARGLDTGEIRLRRGGTLEADPHTTATNLPGVFAGGDATSGPATVVEAIAAGNRAAAAIDRYLRGEPTLWDPPAAPSFTHPPETIKPDYQIIEDEARRPVMPSLDVERCKHSFQEIEQGYTRETAITEARRCLRCDLEAR